MPASVPYQGARSVNFFELVFAYSADGANPIVGDVFKFSSGSDAAIGVANRGVINPIANFTDVFIHNCKFISW